MIDLQKAIEIAVATHAAQKDKAGAPYILHPLRVMLSLESDDERIVGVLHDVLEDGKGQWPGKVRQEMDPRLLASLELVTKTEEEEKSGDYMAFIRRLAPDPIARRVKLADLRDNLNVLRLEAISEKDRDRLNKYLVAFRFLSGIADETSGR
jgi:(p)ppGpp synthase/HD superfamily hydrolase